MSYVTTSLTFKGDNGTFTGVYYKRNGEWFGGTWDRQTDKRTYSLSVRDAWCAADVAITRTKKAAGENAKVVL